MERDKKRKKVKKIRKNYFYPNLVLFSNGKHKRIPKKVTVMKFISKIFTNFFFKNFVNKINDFTKFLKNTFLLEKQIRKRKKVTDWLFFFCINSHNIYFFN